MSDQTTGEQTPSEKPPPAAKSKRVDPLDRPARPLGSKRGALQAQRHRRSVEAWRAGLGSSMSNDGPVIASTDGSLAFAIVRTPNGLLVERRHWPRNGPRMAQTLVFDDTGSFDRWCDAEPVRFDDPQLFAQLRRQGHEMLDADQ